MRSEDYVGNSPMSAGLQRLGVPSTTFQHTGGPSTSAASIPLAGSTSQRFLRESTPQTIGTAGGISVAPHLAQATGPGNMTSASRLSGLSTTGLRGIAEGPESAGNVAVQNSTAEDFPAAEELSVEGSAPSAPSTVFGQVRHGRLNMDEEPPLAAFPASSVAAGLSASPDVMHNIDRDLAQTGSGSPVGHHHAYEKSGFVLPRPAGVLATESQQ